nr:unnamed protein product [Callosobruchus chinensis]
MVNCITGQSKPRRI